MRRGRPRKTTKDSWQRWIYPCICGWPNHCQGEERATKPWERKKATIFGGKRQQNHGREKRQQMHFLQFWEDTGQWSAGLTGRRIFYIQQNRLTTTGNARYSTFYQLFVLHWSNCTAVAQCNKCYAHRVTVALHDIVIDIVALHDIVIDIVSLHCNWHCFTAWYCNWH